MFALLLPTLFGRVIVEADRVVCSHNGNVLVDNEGHLIRKFGCKANIQAY